MKALMILLVVSLSAPVWAQDLSGSTTSGTTTTTTTDETVTTDESSALSPTKNTESNYDLSGSSTAPTSPSSNLAPAPATTETTTRTYREDTYVDNRNTGGLFIEPAILGSRQDADIESSLTGADTNGTSNGFGVDLKLGGHVNEMFFLAASGRYERTQLEGSAYDDADADVWTVGPTVGLQAPVFGLRLWGTYVLDGSYNPEAGAQDVNLRFDDPYGWRVGAGIRLSTVSLNLEYEDLTYQKSEIESFGSLPTADVPIDFAQRGYIVSLSFPMDL
jgi:hypothetical protein